MLAQLKLASNFAGTSQVIPSPNGRYLAYVTYRAYDTVTPETFGNFIELADTLTQKMVIVPDVYIDRLEIESGYRIRWSSDGSAFTIRRHSDFGSDEIYYVSGYSDDLSAIKTTHLELFEAEGRIVGIRTDFSGLSNDGRSLILSGRTALNEVNLFLWQVDNPLQNRILLSSSHTFMTADFSPDERSVIFINQDGLQRIDVETGEITMIDASINSTWIFQAFFSPDKTKIALIERLDGIAENRIYVVDIP